VALTNLRWRRSPFNPEKIESNARILRWSDGSLTLQLATNPTEQYELPAKALAPPQHNPAKPTPTSVQSRNGVTGAKAMPYNPQADAHTYLTTPHESASLLRTTNHLTTSLTVLPSSEFNDEALIRLHDSLAKAVRGKSGVDGGIARIVITEDPELQKKRAEAAEKEKVKAQRRKDQAEQRERQRANRVSSMRQGNRYGTGLSAGALEDDDMATSGGVGRKRPAMNKKKVPRRRDDYESDEDDRQRYSTREDEYDRGDDFLADSDEEEEYEGDDKDDDEDLDEGIDEVDEEAEEKQQRVDRKRERKDERRREDDIQKDQDAAEAAAGSAARVKRRRVVDDDDE
jgi:RNA polymerase-associated protein LEO1